MHYFCLHYCKYHLQGLQYTDTWTQIISCTAVHRDWNGNNCWKTSLFFLQELTSTNVDSACYWCRNRHWREIYVKNLSKYLSPPSKAINHARCVINICILFLKYGRNILFWSYNCFKFPTAILPKCIIWNMSKFYLEYKC